ncbi:MAG: hypothetical protein P8X39_03490 [Desulfofustis sp.]|jgi:hypothetical protein
MHNADSAMIFRIPFYALTLSLLLFGRAVMAAPTDKDAMMTANTAGGAAQTGSGAIPLIDQAAPTTFETATFGLG